jgi:murein DD-endopeptidase MepM/ murein hydrolase activator NlpD
VRPRFAAAVVVALTSLAGVGLVADGPRAALARVDAPVEQQRPPAVRWEWPLRPRPPVVRAFDPPPQPWLAGHRGVDLAGEPSATVYAAGAGTVVYAGRIAGRGVVSVAHAGGLRTTYEPVAATVRAGDTVGTGVQIGTLEPGHDGCPAAACLHWGLRRGPTYLDPLLLLRPIRVRLKPL